MIRAKCGDILITVIVLLVRFSFSYVYSNANGNRDSDICGHWNGRRHFLELGDRGELHAHNISNTYARNYMYTNIKNNTVLWYQCNLELVTCSDCVIRVTFTYTNFSKVCERPNRNIGNPSSRCPCDHIQFSEPPYDTEISGEYFCGDGKVFRSQTRSLLLKFFFKTAKTHIFSLQYFSERNVKIISGTPKQSIVSNNSQISPKIISTPYFPVPYPRDYGIEHIFSCDSDNCHVRLDFTDFQIGLTSTMEIFDSNGQMLDTYTGEHFRPPIIVSSGNSLILQFRGNGVTGPGYRAEITFISRKQLSEKDLIPVTDCGGMVGSFGGAITMMNMIENATNVRYYDCIWIVKPGSNYMLMKTHIMLRVDALHGMASSSELFIKQGTTSIGSDMEVIRWPGSALSKTNHVVPIMAGFYVRLKGVFGLSSRLAIVYSVFNYINCYIGSEFLCQNNHCISVRLHCDGFDHCGDGSDEPEKCEEDWAHSPSDRRWYSHKANYYFPKTEQYPDLKTATGIFIVSTLGILLVISGWMVILYRIGVRARNQRELQNHLQTISELLDRQDDLPVDDPPDYEAPPDYEEVIKVGMEDQMRTPRRAHRHNGRRRHHTGQNRSQSAGRSDLLADRNTPSCSNVLLSNNLLQPEQIQEMVNSVLVTTAYCEIAESTPAAGKRFSWRDKGCQTSTTIENFAPSNATEPSFSSYQENSSCSNTTLTQFDEHSSEFRDDSLNVSLTLAMPRTQPSETNPLRPKNISNPLENNCFKKTWLMFSSGDTIRNENEHGPTLSAAEALTNQDMNYGSYLQSDRNSFISNASTFGSELPIDRTPDSDFEQNFTPENPILGACSSSEQEADERDPILTERQDDDLDCNDNQSNADEEVSCFGHGSIFGVTKRQRNYVRSKSFNQDDERTELKALPRLQRSSSADLLLLTPSR